jgi:hypothetical protein
MTTELGVQSLCATQEVLIQSHHRIAVSVDRIGESLFRVTRRRRIAGSSEGKDDVRVCAVCAKPLSAESGDWTKVNEAVYHNPCWDRRVARARAAANAKPEPRQ